MMNDSSIDGSDEDLNCQRHTHASLFKFQLQRRGWFSQNKVTVHWKESLVSAPSIKRPPSNKRPSF